MATAPNFIGTPRVAVGSLTTGQTARTSGTTTNVVDVISAGTNGTRILELVVKSDNDPADSIVCFWLHDGTTNWIFDEMDIGNPAAGSTTVVAYRNTVTYANLVIPSGWKLQASITVTPTAGNVLVFALGGNL